MVGRDSGCVRPSNTVTAVGTAVARSNAKLSNILVDPAGRKKGWCGEREAATKYPSFSNLSRLNLGVFLSAR